MTPHPQQKSKSKYKTRKNRRNHLIRTGKIPKPTYMKIEEIDLP